MKMKRLVFLILTMLLVVSTIASCGENTAVNNDTSTKETNADASNSDSGDKTDDGLSAQETTNNLDIYNDNLQEQDFGGAQFRIAARDEPWLYVIYDSQEENGDLINDAVYKRNRKIEERFNIVITQDTLEDVSGPLKKNVKSGVDAYELYLPVDREALNFGADGTVYKISDLPNVDLTKPYWSQSLNECLTIGGDLYFAYGAFNLSVYDYTHVLLFNKQMMADLGLENLYNTVRSGEWTFDKYAEMARAATKDFNGNGVIGDDGDIFGLVSMDKHVLPCFWIGAGVQAISKSEDDIPQFNLRTDEKFASVIDKIFDITYGNNSRYCYTGELTEDKTIYLIDGYTLFADASFKGISDLRSIETDFGIIPYPKYTADQTNYYTRVEGGNPAVVPVTSLDTQMIGTILEALNSEGAKTVIPAYYDVTLKTKHARDEESSQMLDLIFDGRIYDLGDTYWCSVLRDGIFLNMYSKNDRALASQLEKVEPKINSEIDKVVKALNK